MGGLFSTATCEIEAVEDRTKLPTFRIAVREKLIIFQIPVFFAIIARNAESHGATAHSRGSFTSNERASPSRQHT
jgi:hypothetical protein